MKKPNACAPAAAAVCLTAAITTFSLFTGCGKGATEAGPDGRTPWQPSSAAELQYDGRGMVLIVAAGYGFTMGNDSTVQNEAPAHGVSFTYSFWMDTVEVTQGDYAACIGVRPFRFDGDSLPAENINWYEAVLYCNARSKRDGLDTVYSYSSMSGTIGLDFILTGVVVDFTKNGYRLPTEAEWEYACRGGTVTDYFWGVAAAGDHAWYALNSNDITHEGGLKSPNAYGLHDLCGNVWEWCNDWWYRYDTDETDPTGAEEGQYRLIRGGGFSDDETVLRSSYREYVSPSSSRDTRGVRTVRRAQ